MIRVETERGITKYCGATVRESERTHDHKKNSIFTYFSSLCLLVIVINLFWEKCEEIYEDFLEWNS